MNKDIIILMLLIIGYTSCKSSSQLSNSVNNSNASLEVEIRNMLHDSEFIGMGVGVLRNGEINYVKGFGYSNLEEKKEYSTKSIQPVGSISKLFIGVAIAKAIEQGYFNLETNINDILPFSVHNPHSSSSEIKVFHLVTHTSGISDSDLFWSNCYFIQDSAALDNGTQHIKNIHLARAGEMPSLKELISNYFKEDGKLYSIENFNGFEAGQNYEYTNVGSSLAAYLIEVETGISFKKFCEVNIFKPLKLENTSWQTPKIQEYMATLYKDKNTPIPQFQLSSYPDGGLHTTVEDLTIFMKEMIKGYSGKSKFMNKESFRLMFDKKFETLPSGYSPETNSGIFWDWGKSGRLGHNGSDPGLFTDLSFDTKTKDGTIILFNKEIIGVGEWKIQYKKFLKLKELLIEFEKK